MDQLPNNIPVTYFPISLQNIVKFCSHHLKTKCFKLWQDLVSVFRICYNYEIFVKSSVTVNLAV